MVPIVMKVQLRIYTTQPGEAARFAQEWRDRIRPLRERLGFRIHGAWIDPETDRFFWVLSHPGPGEWSELDRLYHESDERRAMDPNPARLLLATEERFVDPVT